MSALFDWGNTYWRFNEFHGQLSTHLTKHSSDYSEQVYTLKQFAFNLFDMNCDGFICENDILTLLNSMRTCSCLPYLYKDLILIEKLLYHKQQDILNSDPIIDSKTNEI